MNIGVNIVNISNAIYQMGIVTEVVVGAAGCSFWSRAGRLGIEDMLIGWFV